MPRRLKYLILAICFLAATLSVLIFAGAAIRYNRAAGLFDAPHEIAEPSSRTGNSPSSRIRKIAQFRLTVFLPG